MKCHPELVSGSYMKVIPSIGILIIKENKVLLVKHGPKATHLTGVYGLPAGKVEERGEKETAVKELMEETGLVTTVDNLNEFPNNEYSADIETKSGEVVRYPWRVFLCTNYSGSLKSSEETTPEWVEISKLNDYDLLPNVNNAINAGIKFLEMLHGDV